MKICLSRLALAAGLALGATINTSAALAAPLLAVDVNDRTAGDAPNTPPGFLPATMTGTTAALGTDTISVGGYVLTLTAVNAAGEPAGNFDDRDRSTPSTTPDLAQVYDDFLFVGASAGIGGGLDLQINSNGALEPNTQYFFSVYSFDSGSTPLPQPRTSDWFDGNNSNALVFNTAFSGATLPTTDDQYKFTGSVLTDAQGNLLLRARGNNVSPTTGNAEPGVFLNGFEINVIPEPSSLALAGIAAIALIRRPRRR